MLDIHRPKLAMPPASGQKRSARGCGLRPHAVRPSAHAGTRRRSSATAPKARKRAETAPVQATARRRKRPLIPGVPPAFRTAARAQPFAGVRVEWGGVVREKGRKIESYPSRHPTLIIKAPRLRSSDRSPPLPQSCAPRARASARAWGAHVARAALRHCGAGPFARAERCGPRLCGGGQGALRARRAGGGKRGERISVFTPISRALCRLSVPLRRLSARPPCGRPPRPRRNEHCKCDRRTGRDMYTSGRPFPGSWPQQLPTPRKRCTSTERPQEGRQRVVAKRACQYWPRQYDPSLTSEPRRHRPPDYCRSLVA